MNQVPDIRICPDAASVQQMAAEWIVALARERIAATNHFGMVLAGGSTPQGLYRRLAAAPFVDQIAWEQVHILWGDERYVSADDPQSNYRMACDTLLTHVSIPSEQIYPVPTSFADPVRAASVYEVQVQSLLEQGRGQLDLVLLGMGPDGHTASLFPHHPALNSPENRLVVAIDQAPKPPPRRISLTFAAINQAAHVLFLVTGADKREALRAVLSGAADPQQWPAQTVRPHNGSVTWMVDSATGLGET